MGNKKFGSYATIFAVLYFLFTAFVIGHGIHFTNSIITIILLIIGVYFYVEK